MKSQSYIAKPGVYKSGKVKGRKVADILLDTGCSRTAARQDLVPEQKKVEGEAVAICCAHGTTVLYPIAQVEIEIRGQIIEVEAAISETLPMSMLLGTDVPSLPDFLMKTLQASKERRKQVGAVNGAWQSEVPKESHKPGCALAMVTRAQKKAEMEAEFLCQQEVEESEVQSSSIEEDLEVDSEVEKPNTEESEDPHSSDGMEVNIEKTSNVMHSTGLMDYLPDFDDSLFEGGRERIKQIRSEKRQYRQKHQKGGESSSLEKDRHTLEISAQELISLQGTDPTLAEVRKAAKSYSSSAGVGFFEKNGLIYRHRIPPGRGTEDMAVDQLVLPQQCRSTVLDLAHRIPLAGHLGRDKTAQ